MKAFRTLTILVVIITQASFSPKEETEEIIRRKVENMSQMTIAVGMEQIHCSKALPRFYETRFFEQVWVNPRDAKAFLNELNRASEHGLNPKDYHIDQLNAMLEENGQSPLTVAEREMLMTDAYLLYISHLVNGKVNPENIDPEWHVSKSEMDPVEIMNKALSEGSLAESIQKLQPTHNTYKSLKNALIKYRKLKDSGGWQQIDAGETLKPGMIDPRVVQVRERLSKTGDFAGEAPANVQEFDEGLKEAVQKFQKRHGIDSDGSIGAKTLAAMNVTATDRVAQIRANMERWRWLDHRLSDYYLMVNIADYRLEVIRDQKLEREHKVMVGKPYRKTPVFSSTMQYMVLNPTWTVPPTILSNDVLPAVRKNPEYLNTKGLTVYDAGGNKVDPATIDWSSSKAKSYTYRQPAGKNNALGVVKFMFPNSFNVYLHDTPSKELFSKTERAFSSGCIRVEHPVALAKHLLKNDSKWTPEAVDQAVAKGVTETIQLAEKPTVYLLYWTAWTDSSGAVQFRPDVYERDVQLIEALREEDPTMVASSN